MNNTVKRFTGICLAAVMCLGLFGGCGKDKKEPVNEGLIKREEYIAFLNETYKDYQEVEYGLDITKKTDLVGICYSTWFIGIVGKTKNITKNPKDVSKILAGEQKWGSENEFHYWGEPALGYYSSDNADVYRTHMTQLAEAGVDYIMIDNTNCSMGWKNGMYWKNMITTPCTVLLDTIVEMRAEGLKTPYVVFWVGTQGNWDTVNAHCQEFLMQDKWKDCFVYWEGKPFMLITSRPTKDPAYDLTLRTQFGLQPEYGPCGWSFLDIENDPHYDWDDFVEQMCVCVASQETYMSKDTAHGRNHGIFWYEQWANAFQYRPKTITVTWWNEWAAQRLKVGGEYVFTDAYTQEYSRDIEPMKGGHGDQYYQWLKEYIKAYKNLETAAPRLVEEGY